jgi:integrase
MSALPQGIRARHSRACQHRETRCTCKPRFEAQAYDAQVGKAITRTFDTVTAAKRWRSDTQAKVRTGDISAERGPRLDDAVRLWLDGIESGAIPNRSGDPFKPSAVRSYRQTMQAWVLPRLGDRRIREIEPQHVQAMIDELVTYKRKVAGEDRLLSAATIDSALTALRAFYRRAVARGEARVNPTLRIEKPAVRPKKKDVASPSQVAAMIAAVPEADRPLWAVAFYGGLRRGELSALRWEDVDLVDNCIRVCRGWDEVEGEIAPKSAQGKRSVPIPAAMRDHLYAVLADGAEGRVFASARWVQGANDRARPRWEAAGLPHLTLHGARHTYASVMIAAGVNAHALCKYMGHANIKITFDLYGHLLPGNEAEAAGLLDAYLQREGTTVDAGVRHSRAIVGTPIPAVESGPKAVGTPMNTGFLQSPPTRN